MQITAMKSVLLTSYLLFGGIVAVLTPGVLGNDGCTSGCTSYSACDYISSCTDTDMSLCTASSYAFSSVM
jgi:hypothetical protein